MYHYQWKPAIKIIIIYKAGAILIWQQPVTLAVITDLSLIVSSVNAYDWAYLSLYWTFRAVSLIAFHAISRNIWYTDISHIPYYWQIRRDRSGSEV